MVLHKHTGQREAQLRTNKGWDEQWKALNPITPGPYTDYLEGIDSEAMAAMITDTQIK